MGHSESRSITGPLIENNKKARPTMQQVKPLTNIFAQKTVKQPIHCVGVGLHSGARVSLAILPAGVDEGIRFVRTDLPEGENVIRARFDAVADTQLCTVIANKHGATVGTIEHLMAALAGAGVDNAVIELDGAEVPIMDGSARPWVFLLRCAGTRSMGQPRRALRILKPVEVVDGDKRAAFTPSAGARYDFMIDFMPKAPKAIGRQAYRFDMIPGAFDSDLADCRTFGFAEDVAMLRKMGLARGGSLENAVVVEDDKVINPTGLRRPDEFVRHKVLDAVGDLFLAGGPFIGTFEGERAGHDMNNRLLRALFADPTAYEWVDLDAASALPETAMEEAIVA
ncbi:MAG: UDP-3-O-acyl-N-acetylglucosamine deacetylase [Alphaproteobacteria bacterium]